MRSLEVRCCCDAGKIMGWKLFPKETRFRPFTHIKFQTTEGEVDLEVHPISAYNVIVTGENRFALRSNDYPMEQLKQIPGFVPNPEVA